jgi:proton-dependent oligopeptide transporter, POT family
MRALLVLYLTKSIGMDRKHALEVYGVYTGLVYITPLIGGFLADKFLGRRKAVLIGGITMALGHLAMAFEPLLYVALALLIVGNGFFKPNISTMVGGLYSDTDNRRDSAYTIFYMGINLGALWSPILCGQIGESLGWHVGFAIAAIGMVAGLLQFGWGQPNLGNVGLPPSRVGKPSDASGAASAGASLNASDYRDVALWSTGAAGVAWLGTLAGPHLARLLERGGSVAQVALVALLFGSLLFGLFRGATAGEAKRLAVVIILVGFNVFFWMGFEQAGGTMTLFADDATDLDAGPMTLFVTALMVAACAYNFRMTTRDEPTGRTLWLLLFGMFVLLALACVGIGIRCAVTHKPFHIGSSILQAVNPMVIVAFAPTFSRLWVWMDGTKYRLSIPAKMAVGMIVLGLGFVVLFAGQKVGIASGTKISPAWLGAVYIIHTLGELCLSPVGLSMVNKLAPPRVASLAMGAWLGSSAVANYLAGTLESRLEHWHVPIFGFLIFSSVGPALVLLLITPGLKKWMGENAY